MRDLSCLSTMLHFRNRRPLILARVDRIGEFQSVCEWSRALAGFFSFCFYEAVQFHNIQCVSHRTSSRYEFDQALFLRELIERCAILDRGYGRLSAQDSLGNVAGSARIALN